MTEAGRLQLLCYVRSRCMECGFFSSRLGSEYYGIEGDQGNGYASDGLGG